MDSSSPVSLIMTICPISIKPKDTLASIQSVFGRYNFHHIPVVNDANELLGMISKTDLAVFDRSLMLETSGRRFTEKKENATLAEDFMTTDLTILDPEDSIGLAADIFLANIFHALPIVEDKKLVGIVTTHDLLEHAYKGV